MDLSRVDWEAATRDLTEELRGGDTPRLRRRLAAVASLRARFTDDHAVAAAAVATAQRLEPLDPIHRVRGILMKARFGDLAGALADIEALPEAIADLPCVLVIKAFVTLRRGEPATARNIADRAIQIDPGCTAARFLHVEAQLSAQRKGGLDKLVELPRGSELEPAWADLLAKLAILRPGDHRAVSAQVERSPITNGSRADAVVRSVVTWASPATSTDELARIAEAQAAGSRPEALAITLLASRLAAGDPTVACTALHAMARRCGDRPAMRRALVAALTQLAVVEAGATRLAAALRVVQACIDLEPHEPVHQQNLAALFTLSGEHDAAFDAWAALDRLHYRLALLGRLDPSSAMRYAAPHRMFALAARLSPESARSGVFVIERDDDGDLELAVNQDAIDRDPEQLRAWLHHSRAALGFELIALGMARDRLLLGPTSPEQAVERAQGLALLVQSFGVLVPDEGRRLADALAKRFQALGDEARQRYRPPELDPAAQVVQHHAIELYSELALLCFAWSPDPSRRGLVDEVIETVRAVAPMFDEDALARLSKDTAHDAPSALSRLRGRMLHALRIAPEDRERPLDARQRQRFARALGSRLRVQRVCRRLDDAEPAECEQLADELDAARRDDPDSPYTEYIAALVLARGSFFDEARRAVAAFHRLVKGDHPLLESLEKLQAQVESARKEGRSKTRSGAQTAAQLVPEVAQPDDVTAHEAALDDQPTSIPLYIELCHALALAGRWREAHGWADRAIARCLASASQLRARELALELLGLEELAAKDGRAVASYVAGARTAPLAVLAVMPDGGVGLAYVRGLCLLAADRRAEARAAFTAALEACTRGIYLAVLRPLAADVEHAVLAAVRQDIDAACKDRRFADAHALVAEHMAAADAPAPYVLELARVQFAATIAAIGTAAPPPVAAESAHGIAIEAEWRGELAAALAMPEPVARIRALIELALRLHPAGARDGAALIRKLDDLAQQLTTVAVLERADARAAAGDLEGALAVLDDAGDASGQHARIVRQRAIVLLQLQRYDVADRAVEQLDALADPIAREFVARYPKLRLRRQLAAATELIRARELDRARALLEAATADAPDQQVELAYARACCAAAEGYRCDETGDRRGALPFLFEALRWAESCLEVARSLDHQRLLALHATLERDVAVLEEAAS